jgi:hypothetical protein
MPMTTDEFNARISQSRLSSYFKCGEKTRRRYLEGDKVPAGVPALMGTGFHRGAAAAHRLQLDVLKADPSATVDDLAAALPDTEAAGEIAVEAFKAEVNAGVTLSREDEARGKALVLGEAVDTVFQATTLYVGAVAPGVRPVGVEHSVTVKIRHRGEAFEVTGIIDLIDAQHEDEEIADQKLRGRKPSADEIVSGDQLTMYGFLRKLETGVAPKRYKLNNLIHTRGGKVSYLPQEGTRDESDFAVLLLKMAALRSGVAAGTFLPASPGSWYCSDKWCEFYRTCKYVNWRKTAEGE